MTKSDISYARFQAYAKECTSDDSDLLNKLIDVSERELDHIDMISGPIVGRLLQLFIHMAGATRILEVGTFTGYGTLTMAEATAARGCVTTIDVNKQFLAIAERFFKKSGLSRKINKLEGYAAEILPELDGPFDLVFLDADKINYPLYYDLIVPKLAINGLLVMDNAYWGGKVLDDEDEKGQAIHQTNKKARVDERVNGIYLPVRDGLHILRKIRA